MFRHLLRCAIIAFALSPVAAVAAPITLKLAFFSSDRSITYRTGIKPFIEAVNAEAKGLVEIVLYSGGVLGRENAKQPQLVLDGTADIAFVVPGYTPERFPDSMVLELPGLFRDMREATLAYTQLIADNALKGYENFVVIGAYVTEPVTIHSRPPINSIADLKGKRIRVNNIGAGAALEKLGAVPVLMEVTRITDAISSGSIDGAAVSNTPLSDYGIKRVAAYHYFLHIGGAPLALLMNRKKFDELPKAAQDIIRKYSGEWAAARFIEAYEVFDEQLMQQLKPDLQRKIIFPSQPDLDRAQVAFTSVIEEWAEKSTHNRELLNRADAEIAKVRSTPKGSDAVTR
ncbi:MAG TPA: TRAP transporter substrate-binding protein DctP [Steroidobacteraceae bacterium]|nr:TRAP transporter substrate-binding protein DctP [Steroidobacteraceae bacterium]